MLDNEHQDDGNGEGKKINLTPKQLPQAMPICTVMSDGSLKVVAEQFPLVELNRLLLAAAGTLTERTVQRASAMERVLTSVHRRFDGFDAETDHAIATVLSGRA